MSQDTLLEFPCDFPVKIMGMQRDDFAPSMVEIVLRHAPDFAAESVEMRASATGKYLPSPAPSAPRPGRNSTTSTWS
jgi:putative lipoic acid-binding regulatory protein